MRKNTPANSIAIKKSNPAYQRACELVKVVNGLAVNRESAINQLQGEGYSLYVAKAAVTFATRLVAPEIISNTMSVADARDWLEEECGVVIDDKNLTHELTTGKIKATVDLRTTPEALREWVQDRPRVRGREMGKVYVFDLFGTLARQVHKPAKTIGDLVFLPGVELAMEYLRDRGQKIAIASNQGGVAYGLISFAEAESLVSETAKHLGAHAWRMCPHHPDGSVKPYNKVCRCRKPAPNMLISLQKSILSFNYQQRPMVYVGDTDIDRQTAINAGVEFIKASSFFGQFVTRG